MVVKCVCIEKCIFCLYGMMGVDCGNLMNCWEIGVQFILIKGRNGYGIFIFFDVKIREGGGVLIGIMFLFGVGGLGGEGRN